MSHFTVLVIGANVEEQLAPFAEFECTGKNNEFVLEIDQTAECRADYEKDTRRRYKDPDGNLHDPYEARFYREPTQEELDKHRPIGMGGGGGISWDSRDWKDGRGYRPKIHFLPDGWEDVQVPCKDIMSFRDFVEYQHERHVILEDEKPDFEGEHKFGYTVVDKNGEVIKTVDRTNPRDGVFSWRNAEGREIARTISLETKPTSPLELKPYQVAGARWDWYQVGGRWNGFFQMKRGVCGLLGQASLVAKMDRNYTPPQVGTADQAVKGDVDFEAMRNKAGQEAGERWDKVYAVIGEDPIWMNWANVLERFPNEVDKARDFYHGQETLKKLRASDLRFWDYDDYLCTREEYVENARKDAFRTFAVLKDGVWYEKGRMGWWACVHDEKEEDTWRNMFNKLLDETPDSELLTICDCHI